MNRWLNAAMAGIVLALAAAAPSERRLVNPYWLQQPNQGEIAKALTAQGRNYEGYRGLVLMVCTATGDGRLEACAVPDTSTRDEGLKKAALSLAPLFKTKPQDSAWEDVPGARVLLAINFEGRSASGRIEPRPLRPEAAADLECALAARRHWLEDFETVEPGAPPSGYAYMSQTEWLAKRSSLQGWQQAQDSEAQAFFEGRLSVRDRKADWRAAEADEMSRDLAGAATNDATFARCQGRMRDLRHLPAPIPPAPMPMP